VGLLGIFHFADFSEESTFDTTSKEIASLQNELDSIRNTKDRLNKSKQYKFNPNFIDDYKGYTLGMSVKEIDRLLQYRSDGNWINSVRDFQQITMVSDSLLHKIAPLFKFPEWVTKKPKFRTKKIEIKKEFSQKFDINLATESQLQKINGIGKTLSKRVIDYRNKLGGFTSDVQLYNVYGLEDLVVNRLLNEFTVKSPKEILKLNLNEATASDLSTIPDISFELAKKIWEYRRLHERVNSISELKKIEGMSERKLEVIHLYLSLD